jgi:hypothetical protein
MHLRTVLGGSGKVKRRYAQLVQSFRRDDGVPAQRVVANLGALSDREVANLRLALAASREGKAVVLRAGIDDEPAYCLTEPTQAQRTVLRSLRMTRLIDDQEVAAQIHPRRHP